MIGTATLNSLGLKEKANLMPRGEKLAEIVSTPLLPFPRPPKKTTYQFCLLYRYLVIL